MKKLVLVFLIFLPSASANAQTRLFVDPEFQRIGNNHKIIAVIPFQVSISLRPKQMATLREGQLEKMEEDESRNIQMALYAWFLKRREQGKMWVDIQDASTTTAILSKNGVNYANIDNYTPEEIARLLNVDAIVRGTFETDKPMSEGASLALGLLVGFWGATNQTTINMFIHNAEDGKVLVNYNKGVAGSVGSTSDQLINVVMRKASRRIPYTKPKV